MDKWQSLRQMIENIHDANQPDVVINCRNFCVFLLEYMKVLEKGEQDGSYERSMECETGTDSKL